MPKNAALLARLAESASQMPPGLAEKTLARRMAQIEPDYRKLFADRNLPDDKATKVLDVIRERVQNLINENLRYSQEATLEVGDHTDRARVRASLDKAKAKWESALFVEQQQLLSILGPDRYQELKDMEEKQKQAARKKAIAEETD